MPELTREEKLKLMEKLPKRLQDFLYSEDAGAFLLYFEKKYNLPSEKASLLSNLVADIVLGITPITSLAQEINSKITPDAQTAMNLAQELNAELLAPVMAPVPLEPAISVPAPAPATIPPRPAAPPMAPTPAKPIDTYREPVNGAPEIIDLRKTPPPPMPAPVAPAPIPARQWPEPQAMAGGPPSPRQPAPLTFTKPVEKAPLIEANPHKVPPPAPAPQPQYIIRPPGLAPTDLPQDVLDLRRDRGEF